jgi:transcriptional regulator with XRE-family HTH domain
MPPRFALSHYSTWAELIRGLADHHHNGSLLQIAKRAGLTQAIVYSWAHGTIKRPGRASLATIAEAYELNSDTLADFVAAEHKRRAK